MAVSTGAAIIGGAVISGLMGADAAKSSAKTSARASRRSIAEQRRQFDLSRADRAPYRAVGEQALFSLSDMMGQGNPYEEGTEEYTAFESREKYDFTETPGYQFRLGEGQKALERSQAGRHLGGRAAKEAIRFGQGEGSQEFGAAFKRLSTLAGYGPPSLDTGGPTGVPGTIEAGGRAKAGYDYAGAESVNQAVQGGLSNWMTYNTMGGGGGYEPRLDTGAGTLY